LDGVKAADLCLVNTCTVTKEADRSSLNLIRRLVRLSPKPKIIVTGCLAERAPKLVASIPGVDGLLTLAERHRLIRDKLVSPQRSRATLKIQDGCDGGCSFCISSRLRGRPCSRPIPKIKEEIEELSAQGYEEIVLVGLNLGAYGQELGSSLVELLRELSKLPRRPRIRLSSLSPQVITPQFLTLFKELPLCRHLHLPLQSGDPEILSHMGRNYTPDEYRDRVELAADLVPGICIGTDLLVGYPGEDGEAFERTLRLVSSLPIAYLHVFSYSRRPGTPAAELEETVSLDEKRRRSKILRQLGLEHSYRYRLGFLEETLAAVAEPDGCLTDNYIRVKLSNNHLRAGQRISVKITQVLPHETRGEWKP
jgi:threonylcarbamoyladenosine tRNA methylthiotransferase MtaB